MKGPRSSACWWKLETRACLQYWGGGDGSRFFEFQERGETHTGFIVHCGWIGSVTLTRAKTRTAPAKAGTSPAAGKGIEYHDDFGHLHGAGDNQLATEHHHHGHVSGQFRAERRHQHYGASGAGTLEKTKPPPLYFFGSNITSITWGCRSEWRRQHSIRAQPHLGSELQLADPGAGRRRQAGAGLELLRRRVILGA